MDQTPYSLATQPLGENVQLPDQHCQYRRRFEQVNGDEMIRRQHLAQLQVVFHTITEQTAGIGPPFAPHRDDAALSGASRSGELPREPQPSGKVNRRDCLTDQRIDRPYLFSRKQFDNKVRHNSPVNSGTVRACATLAKKALTQIKAGRSTVEFNPPAVNSA